MEFLKSIGDLLVEVCFLAALVVFIALFGIGVVVMLVGFGLMWLVGIPVVVTVKDTKIRYRWFARLR